MESQRKITDKLATLVNAGVQQYVANVGQPDFDYCPMIMWSLGGEMVLADGKRGAVPARYELGVADRAEVSKRGFAVIGDDRVGLLAFEPREEDLASERRLIDYDGETIVVR